MKKRLLSVLLAGAMVCSLPMNVMAAEGAGEEEITLSLWTWSPITRTAEKMIEAFETEHPNIRIDFTYYNYNPEYLSALSAASASDNMPDVMGLQPGSLTQTYKDYLIDYSEYAEADWGENWEDNFYSLSAEQITLGNAEGDESCKILPIETQDIYIEYNKALFEELGLSAPTTYDELVNCANVLKENGIAPLYFGGADGWQHVNLFLMVVSQMDRELFDKCQNGEKSWNNETILKAMENYKKLFDDGVIQEGALSTTSYSAGTNLFLAGQAGMMVLGSWWVQENTADDVTEAVENWDYDYFYLPGITEGCETSAPIGGVDFGYGITTNCEHPEAAWEFIKSCAVGAGAEAIANDLNNHLSWKEVKVTDTSLNEKVVDEFNRSGEDLNDLMNQRIAEPTIETAVQEALQGLAGDQYTPEEAAAHIQEAQDAL